MTMRCRQAFARSGELSVAAMTTCLLEAVKLDCFLQRPVGRRRKKYPVPQSAGRVTSTLSSFRSQRSLVRPGPQRRFQSDRILLVSLLRPLSIADTQSLKTPVISLRTLAPLPRPKAKARGLPRQQRSPQLPPHPEDAAATQAWPVAKDPAQPGFDHRNCCARPQLGCLTALVSLPSSAAACVSRVGLGISQ